MKTIGLLGGMSWESTIPYYRIINEVVKERLGGLHSAKIVLYSVDFHEIERLQHSGEWDEAGRLLAKAASALQAAGANFIVLCTNTMHKVSPALESAVSIPLLHIADATAEEIRRAGLRKAGLLGTRFTMEQEFYKDRLRDKHGLDVLIPNDSDRATVHRIIYEELCQGKVLDASLEHYQRIIRSLIDRGVEAIILGCTEISMLVGPKDSSVPLFDTTRIHAQKAAEWALSEGLSESSDQDG
jgi:aspartate racemase